MSIIKNDSFFTHGRSLGVYSFAIVALFAFALVSDFQRSIETPTSVAVSQSSNTEMMVSQQTYQLPKAVDVHSRGDVLLETTELALRLPPEVVLRDGRNEIVKDALDLGYNSECGQPSMVVSQQAPRSSIGIAGTAVERSNRPACSLVVADRSLPLHDVIKRLALFVYSGSNEIAHRIWEQTQRKMQEHSAQSQAGVIKPKARPFTLLSPEPVLNGKTAPAVVAVSEVRVRRGLGANSPELMTVGNGYVFDRTTVVDGSWVLVGTAQGNGYVPKSALLILGQ